MKKGFTLVELLAVIVILAIILAIAIPSISSIIENTQVQAYHDNEKLMVKAVKTYLGITATTLPINIGDTIEVTLDTLQTNGYISTIKDPKNKAQTCDGYVLITKIDTGNYDYEPYLNCESDIGSSLEDGLLAHYTFDDFQEPTINLFSNVSNDSFYVKNGKALEVLSMANNEVIYRNYFTGETISYKGWDITVDTTKVYTYSLWAYVSTEFNGSSSLIANGEKGFSATFSYDMSKKGTWQYFEKTAIPTTTTARILMYPCPGSANATAGYVLYKNVQFEEKSYATPFINGTRTGRLTDYSINGNHANLPLANTPRWVNNYIVGEGAYYLDANDHYATLGNISDSILKQGTESNSFTLSAWIKLPDELTTDGLIIGRPGYHDGLQINSSRKVYFDIFDEVSAVRRIMSNTISLNEWHYIVGTYTNKTMYLYIDGKLIGSNNYFNLNPAVKFKEITSAFKIGNSIASAYPLKGYIDDVRIYGRAQTAEEIKYNYDTLK